MLQNQPTLSWKQLAIAEAILAGAMLLALAFAASVGLSRYGTASVLAALVAFAICWLPNALSLLLVAMFRDPTNSVAAMLGGMLLRMGLPAAFAVLVLQAGHWLVGVGLLPMVLVMYLTALVVETVLSVWLIGAGSRTPMVKAS